jgi:TetR/AcrR family transcriptional regulator, cholesterol catabolism regulator
LNTRGAATRERVLQVAIRLFAEKGYHATGVAEIGETVGIKRGALYHHIGSKDELLYEVLRPHVVESLAGEKEIVAQDLSPAEKVRQLARHHLKMIVGHRDEVAIVLRDLDALSGRRRQKIRRLQNEVEAVWQKVIDEGAERGEFVDAGPVIVKGILSMLNMTFSWYKADRKFTDEFVADSYSALLLDGLRGSGPHRGATEKSR